MDNFEQWFQRVVARANAIGQAGLINTADPESYREYWDDGDDPAEVVALELSYVD